jgi:hypothetical protein
MTGTWAGLPWGLPPPVGFCCLAVPTTAYASTLPAVQMKICNATPGTTVVWAWLSGTNQNGSDVTTSGFYLGGYRSCHTVSNWWWETNTFISVGYNTSTTNNEEWSQLVLGSNGGTFQVNL